MIFSKFYKCLENDNYANLNKIFSLLKIPIHHSKNRASKWKPPYPVDLS